MRKVEPQCCGLCTTYAKTSLEMGYIVFCCFFFLPPGTKRWPQIASMPNGCCARLRQSESEDQKVDVFVWLRFGVACGGMHESCKNPGLKIHKKASWLDCVFALFSTTPSVKHGRYGSVPPVTTFRGAREVDKSKLTTNGKVNWSVKRFLGADPSGAAYPSCPDTTPDRILYCFVQFSEGTLQITLSARPRIVEVSFFQYFSSSFADAVCTNRNIRNMAQGLP